MGTASVSHSNSINAWTLTENIVYLSVTKKFLLAYAIGELGLLLISALVC